MSGNSNEDINSVHGVIMTAKWGWTENFLTGRWTNPQQAIKRSRVGANSFSEDFKDEGQSVHHSKLKVRGQGKALSIRYESEDGKDFSILGWAIPFTGDEG